MMPVSCAETNKMCRVGGELCDLIPTYVIEGAASGVRILSTFNKLNRLAEIDSKTYISKGIEQFLLAGFCFELCWAPAMMPCCDSALLWPL